VVAARGPRSVKPAGRRIHVIPFHSQKLRAGGAACAFSARETAVAVASGAGPAGVRDNGCVPPESRRTSDDDVTTSATDASATDASAAHDTANVGRPQGSGREHGAASGDVPAGASTEGAAAEGEQAGSRELERPDAAGDLPIREETVVESEHTVRVRRTPRYGRFMILGGAIFAVAAFIATYSFPQGSGYDRNTVFGFVLLAAVAVGVGLGALAAIIASAATKHTERTVMADRIDVRMTDARPESSELPDLGELPAEAEHDEGRPRDEE
jgi:hypothetical protein